MNRILHISCDYPDRLYGNKTRAISNLVKHSTGADHIVFSLNRSALPTAGHRVQSDGGIFAIRYWGLPFGIGLRLFLIRVATRLRQIITENRLQVDVIHCHKLSVEAIVGQMLSKWLDIPFVCTVRGDSDLKVLRFKPTYRHLYRSILQQSEIVFFVAPWTQSELQKTYPEALAEKSQLLPNIVDLSFSSIVPEPALSNRFVTVCHLHEYRRKNLHRLIRAFDKYVGAGHDMYLDIIGTGPPVAMRKLGKDLARTAHSDRFRHLGHLGREELVKILPAYAGLLLPSYPETFGMVYLESLRAGIPFLHSRVAGVDGYFNEHAICHAVDHRSIQSIYQGIAAIDQQQLELKNRIRAFVESGELERFNAPVIATAYQQSINRIIGP